MQIFPRHLNLLPLVIAGAATVGGGVLTGAIWYYAAPDNLQVGYAPEQPVPYSHRLHAGELEMDCRYCHANVERSHEAMVPPTQTCMGCHTQVLPDSERLAPVRESFETGAPVEWVRVHQVPDTVFFDHSVHLSAGGCARGMTPEGRMAANLRRTAALVLGLTLTVNALNYLRDAALAARFGASPASDAIFSALLHERALWWRRSWGCGLLRRGSPCG